MSALTVADVQFIAGVAGRRFGGADPPAPDPASVEAALGAASEGTALRRAAALAGSLLTRSAFAAVPLHTTLLVLHCSLALDGLSLLAPQGVLVGMIRSLATSGDTASFEHWLEDRAVPSASGG